MGVPAQEPKLKPRMPKSVQFFENAYPEISDDVLSKIADFDADVHQYYDLRDTDRPVDAFSDQIAKNSTANMDERKVQPVASRQGFRLDR